MKKILLTVLTILTMSCGSCSTDKPVEPKDPQKITLGDPFIMLHEGVYYAYGTNAADGIEVLTSTNLESWSYANKLALHKDDVWADRWFWAPEVYHIDGKFYMYYSADEHICVAVADSPFGPFKQTEKRPMLADEKCIDNHLFIDDDGKRYMYFDRFNDGLNIWAANLSDDMMDIKQESLVKCINVSQPWEEVWPRVNEGAWVHKHNGKYYLMYSANSYESPFYGIGYATADSPWGPWTKYDKNPILQKPQNGKLVGTGHHSLFTDKDGKLRIVFHAHFSNEAIHPRHMYISTVNFDQNGVMSIDENFSTPYLKQ